jgi:hypothetical protein
VAGVGVGEDESAGGSELLDVAVVDGGGVKKARPLGRWLLLYQAKKRWQKALAWS